MKAAAHDWPCMVAAHQRLAGLVLVRDAAAQQALRDDNACTATRVLGMLRESAC
jgi:hypothetical protein